MYRFISGVLWTSHMHIGVCLSLSLKNWYPCMFPENPGNSFHRRSLRAAVFFYRS
jgi:hypothetical protein